MGGSDHAPPRWPRPGLLLWPRQALLQSQTGAQRQGESHRATWPLAQPWCSSPSTSSTMAALRQRSGGLQRPASHQAVAGGGLHPLAAQGVQKMGPQKSHGPSGSDWRREWTVGRGADRLPAGGYHKATGWERLGKDTERADREEDDDGDNPRDPDDDANGDHTHLMQTQMGGSSSSGERETVPQGCLAGAWKLPTPPSGRSADGGHC